MKKYSIILCILLSAIMLFNGCSSEKSSSPANALAAENQIPADGIITGEQFETIVGKDTVVSFHDQSTDGISYRWEYGGQNIKNPADQNLKITFVKDHLDDVKAAAGNASCAIGMKLTGDGLITVPKLSITLNEKWDADSAALCKLVNGSAVKMSDITLDNSGTTTVLSMNVMETGDLYYIVAGKTIAPLETQNPQSTENKDMNQASKSADGQVSSNSDSRNNDTSGQDPSSSTGSNTCTISISCKTVLQNIDQLTQSKKDFVPSDGWILKKKTVEFEKGESVHDILKRVCKDEKIQMESSYTPGYQSAYIEGINQLYEFDCGELSGWTYLINGWSPNYGINQYTVKKGDDISIRYTCDLGKDTK